MSSTESHLSLLDSVFRSAESLCEGELCWLGLCTLCLLYMIYHRSDHPLHEYLHYFIASRNNGDSIAPCELALVVTHCKTD